MKTAFKKILLLMAVVMTAVVCFAFSASASAETGRCGDNVYWKYNSDTKELIISGEGDMWDYDSNSTFFNQSDIKTIIIENGVTSIGQCVFEDCSDVLSVTIPESITTIEGWAFHRCESIESIMIPEGVTIIGLSAFGWCYSLADITIPDSVNRICEGAFYNTAYYNNTDNWEDGVLYIGKHLIEAKKSAIKTCVIKEGTLTIVDRAFYECSALADITIPDSVVFIGPNAFTGTAYYNNTDNWENGVLYIGHHLIKAKDNVSGCYYIKEGTLSIGDSAFWDANLTDVIIPDSLISIGESAFLNCGITRIIIPDNVVSIGNFSIPGNCVVYCTQGSFAEKYAELNSLYFVVAEFENNGDELVIKGEFGSNFKWCFNKSTEELSISGNEKIPYFDPNYAPWIGYKDCVKKLIIGEGIAEISYNFYDLDFLEEIHLPSTIRKIAQNTFSFCDSLKDVYAYDARTWFLMEVAYEGMITVSQFSGAENLYFDGVLAKNVVIPEEITTVNSLGVSSFECVKSVTIGANVEYIAPFAFSDCSSLTKVVFELDEKNNCKIENIGSSFAGCSIEELVLPYSVKYAGSFFPDLEKLIVCNPECIISFFGVVNTIVGFKGSTAEEFAEENGIDFVDIETVHTHQYKLVDTVLSTCSKEGKKVSRCTCGKETVAVITKKKHTPVTDKAVPSTCGKTGLTEGSHCSVCGEVIVRCEMVPATGKHTGGTATCTKKAFCTVCKQSYGGLKAHDYADATCTAPKTCKACKATAGTAKSHTYTTSTTKATLKKNGKTENKCTVCGTVKSTATIYSPKSIKLSATTYTYNGKTKTPSVTVKDSKGKKLKKGTDYTVTYPKKRKSVGKYTVSVKFKGKYSGTKKLTFEIVPAKVTLSKLTAGSKQLTAAWKTVSGATGYEVVYSTSKKFTKKTTKKVTVKKAKTKKTTIKKLKKGKKYYVKVRVYKTVGKTKIYGAYSSVKNVKVK